MSISQTSIYNQIIGLMSELSNKELKAMSGVIEQTITVRAAVAQNATEAKLIEKHIPYKRKDGTEGTSGPYLYLRTKQGDKWTQTYLGKGSKAHIARTANLMNRR